MIYDLKNLEGLFSRKGITDFIDINKEAFNLKILNEDHSVYKTIKVNHSEDLSLYNSLSLQLREEAEVIENSFLTLKTMYGSNGVFKFEEGRVKIYDPYVIKSGEKLKIRLQKVFDKRFEEITYIRIEDYIYILENYFKKDSKKLKAIKYIYENKEEKILKGFRKDIGDTLDNDAKNANFFKTKKNKTDKDKVYMSKIFAYEELLLSFENTYDLLFEAFSLDTSNQILDLIIKNGYEGMDISLNYYFFYYMYQRNLDVKTFINTNCLDKEDIEIIDSLIKYFYLGNRIRYYVDYDKYDFLNKDISNLVNKFIKSKNKDLIKEAVRKNRINIDALMNNNINSITYNLPTLFSNKVNENKIVDNSEILFEILEMAAKANINIFCSKDHISKKIFNYVDNNYDYLVKDKITSIKQIQFLKFIRNLKYFSDEFTFDFSSEDPLTSFITKDSKLLKEEEVLKFFNYLAYEEDKDFEKISKNELNKLLKDYRLFLENRYIHELGNDLNFKYLIKLDGEGSKAAINRIIKNLEEIITVGQIYEKHKVFIIFNFLEELLCKLEEYIDNLNPFYFNYLKYVSEYLENTLELYHTLKLCGNNKISMYDLLGNLALKGGIVGVYKQDKDVELFKLSLETNLNIANFLNNNRKINDVIKQGFKHKNKKDFFGYINEGDDIVDLTNVSIEEFYIVINDWINN